MGTRPGRDTSLRRLQPWLPGVVLGSLAVSVLLWGQQPVPPHIRQEPRRSTHIKYINPYTLVRKGNEVVKVDPPGRNYPLYRRAHYRENQTRFQIIERFLADRTVDW